MSNVLKRRGPAALAAFLLSVGLSVVAAPSAFAVASCTDSGDKVTVVLDGADQTFYLWSDGTYYYLSSELCDNLEAGTYNVSTTINKLDIRGKKNDAETVTFEWGDLPSGGDMAARWGGLLPEIKIDLVYNADTDTMGVSDKVVLVGSSGNDFINADAFQSLLLGVDRYQIDGGLGKDDIWGHTYVQNDLNGNQDRDTINGGNDDDVIHGNEGDDTIRGNAGYDVINGDTGNDDIFGGVDDDEIYGDAGDDELYGDEGGDDLYGGDDEDSLWGGTGEDYLSGEGDADLVYGGDGADLIHGGDDVADDQLHGDGGDDVFDECGVMSGTGADLIDGGAGSDTVDYSARTAPITVRMPEPGARPSTGNGEEGENDTFQWLENAITGSDDDHLFGSRGSNVLDPGPDGEDFISGGKGSDTVSFQSLGGMDSIEVDLAHNTSEARNQIQEYSRDGSTWITMTGFENVRGSDGDDIIWGDRFANRVEGGLGDDELHGRAGNDRFLEGSDDEYSYDLEDESDGFDGPYQDEIDGGVGRDTLDYSARWYGSDVDDDDDFDEGVVVDLDLYPLLYTEEDEVSTVEAVLGTEGPDYIVGNADDNDLWGYGGDDEIYGRGGRDNIFGGDGDDHLDGEDGLDSISGGDGLDDLYGGAGVDYLTGGGGADQVYGGDGNDVLDGGVDADTDTVDGEGDTDSCFVVMMDDSDSNCEVFLSRRTWKPNRSIATFLKFEAYSGGR